MFSGEILHIIIISSNSHLITLSSNIIHYNIGFRVAIQAHPKQKILHFHSHFFNMDISLIFQHLCLKISIRIVDIH